MMVGLATAFVMGCIGSLHCIGMCGPIALSLPVISNTPASRFSSTLLYNAGRVVTYAALGTVFGSIGFTFRFFGLQQILSITLGLLILGFVFFPKQKLSRENFLSRSMQTWRSRLGHLFLQRNYRSVFFIGILNGLLPCGLVYVAIAGAMETASPWKSSLFMASFGLGTLPLMWTLAFFGSFISLRFRTGIRRFFPVLMAGMAALLILRGLELHIPYLSPGITNHTHSGAILCHD